MNATVNSLTDKSLYISMFIAVNKYLKEELLIFFLATLHVLQWSYLPNQGLNSGHSSESAKSQSLDCQRIPKNYLHF